MRLNASLGTMKQAGCASGAVEEKKEDVLVGIGDHQEYYRQLKIKMHDDLLNVFNIKVERSIDNDRPCITLVTSGAVDVKKEYQPDVSIPFISYNMHCVAWQD